LQEDDLTFEASESTAVFVLKVVTVTFPRNLSCFPGSTISPRSCVAESRLEEEVLEAAVGL